MASQTTKDRGLTNQPGRMQEAPLLGEVLGKIIVKRLSVRHEQTLQLEQAWAEILPPDLAAHCRIEEFSTGTLKVAVDGPGYMHELRLCKKDLCSEINRAVPGARIRDMKLVIGY
jgi:hypothetical protein